MLNGYFLYKRFNNNQTHVTLMPFQQNVMNVQKKITEQIVYNIVKKNNHFEKKWNKCVLLLNLQYLNTQLPWESS